MPVTPPRVRSLLSLYSQLTNASQDIVAAATAIAPEAVGEVLCTIGGLASLGAGPLGPLQSPGTGPRLLSDMGGILAAACPVPPPEPGPVPQPFSGGQCEGVVYVATITVQELVLSSCSPTTQTFQRAIPGPVRGFRLRDPAISPQCPDSDPGAFILESLFGTNTGYGNIYQSSQGARVITSFSIDSLVRSDGMPDDCGDPPPLPALPRPPITQPPDSPPIPTVDPDGNPGPDIIFKPRIGPIFISPSGEIRVPVTINVEGPQFDTDISIPVTVNLPDFSVEIEYGGGGGRTREPVEGDEPTTPEGICCDPPTPDIVTGDEEDPEEPPMEEPDPVKQIIGVVVQSERDGGPERTTELFNPVPTLLVPRVATVQFEVEVGGVTSLSEDYSVKSFSQYIAAPRDVNVRRAFVGFESGWSGSLQYVRASRNPS